MEPRPIPPLQEPPNWARLPIHESGEPLVPLGEGPLRTRPLYAELGIPGADTTLRVRAGVRDRLHHAAASLHSHGIALVVFDGYRSLIVQQALYTTFSAEIARRYPELTGDALTQAINRFVAPPVADPTCPPPHRSGGAVDVYLVDAQSGEPLPMGTEPDEAAPASVTGWYEAHPESPFTENRRLFFHAMTDAGFANYLGEWWHYDWGNQRWANVVGAEAAIYGIADAR